MNKKIFNSFDGNDIPYLEYIHEDGKKYKNVLILHDIGEYIEKYDNFAKFLYRNKYNVYIIEYRGHGELLLNNDINTFGGYNIEEIIKDIRHFVFNKFNNCHYDDVIIFGHSFGAVLTTYLSTTQPFKHIILSGMPIDRAMTITFNQLITKFEILIKKEKSILDKYYSQNNREFRNESEYAWLSRDKEIVEEYINDENSPKHTSPTCYNGLYKIMKYVKKNIKKIKDDIDILIIYGSEDPIVSESKIRKYMKVINNKTRRIKIVKNEQGRHHNIFEINREVIYAEILNWINKLN